MHIKTSKLLIVTGMNGVVHLERMREVSNFKSKIDKLDTDVRHVTESSINPILWRMFYRKVKV